MNIKKMKLKPMAKKIIIAGILVVTLGGGLYAARYHIKDFWEFTFLTEDLIDKALSEPEGQIVTPQTTAELAKLFHNAKANAVPRIYVEQIPEDFTPNTVARKTLFMEVMTALVLRSNEQIQAERHALQMLEEKRKTGREWSKKEMRFFNLMADKYDTHAQRTLESKMAILLRRVDVVPTSLAVAQAIYFTNWGFKNKKSPFGQYHWADNVNYVLQPYSSLIDATDSYMLEMNSMSSMLNFHEARETMAPITNRPLGLQMAHFAEYYMPDDPEYRNKLIMTFQAGLIAPLDKAQLAPVTEAK